MVEQGTHKPLVGSSNLPPGNINLFGVGRWVFGVRRFSCEPAETAKFGQEILRAGKFVLVNAVCHSPTAWVCICNRIFGRSKPTRPSYWRAWVNASHAFSKRGSDTARLAKRQYVSGSDFVLVRNFRQCIGDLLLGWIRAVARGSRRVRERNSADGPLGDVHVDRSHRQDLVWLWVGNPTA